MPSLVLFGRRWGVGSDDFVFPSLIDLLLKSVWFIVTGVFFGKNYSVFHCVATWYVFVGYLAVHQIGIILDATLAHFSSRGGIFENDKRRVVPTILYLRCGSEMSLITWNILSSILYWTSSFHCSENEQVFKFISSLLIFNWVMLAFQLGFCAYAFDFLGASKSLYLPVDRDNVDSNTHVQLALPKTKYSRSCSKTLRLFACRCCDSSAKEDERDAFGELARMFGHMLGGEDLVHSDAVVGFILLGIKHRREKRVRRSTKREWREWNFGSQIQILSEPKESVTCVEDWGSDWRSFKHLSHFLKYASAIFGWKIVAVQQPNPFQELFKHVISGNCIPCRKHPVDVEGDNCCFLETAGIRATLSAEYEDIIFVSFKNHLFEVPFFVSVDHVTKSIVLTCRGSMSINDLTLDFVGWPTQIQGYPPSFKAHRGMLAASCRIKAKLERLGVFSRVFSKYPAYNLVITGHSLGSGCATILSLLFRPQYPNLKCYAYSPPGGLLSKDAADFCDDFVTSITYGDDIVIRLGILQIERVRQRLIQVLKECPIPKYRLLMRGFACCKLRDDFSWLHPTPDAQNFENSYEKFEENGNTLPTLSKDFTISIVSPADSINAPPTIKKHVSQAPSGTRYPSIEGMYPPGKIIHIRSHPRWSRKRVSGTDAGPRWMWRWAERTEFDDMIVSKRMLLDHVPIIIPKSLKYLEMFY